MTDTIRQKTTETTPTVIYILGSAYCGSTILGFLLGASRDVFNAGEVAYYPRLQHQDEMCSCGVPSTECDFWQPVYERQYRVFKTTTGWKKIGLLLKVITGRFPAVKNVRTDDAALFQHIAARANQ